MSSSKFWVVVNSWWLVNALTGVYVTDYFFRAAVTPQLGLVINITQEALYPATFTDIEVRPLDDTNRYVVYFKPDTPHQ